VKIQLKNISYAYETEQVVQDLSADFSSGQFYSLVGPNGSGKTTLLDLISGYFAPDTGAVSIDGTLLSALSKLDIARIMALVSQDHAIEFPFRVSQVLMMGRHPHIPRFSQPSRKDYDMIRRVMDQCRISHLENRRINELSGGERQRCVFARALCQDTPVLLLDEAFSNMDIRHTLQMLAMVKTAVKEQGKMVISVFHDLNLAAAWSDGIVMLRDGRIQAFGPPDTVMTPQMIQAVFGVSAIVEFNPHIQARQVCYPAL